MTPEQRLARGDRAKRILEDELYIESFDIVKKFWMVKIEDSKLGDDALREKAWMMMALLKQLRGTLEYALNDGKVVIHLADVERKKNAR
jgi:hypothetical protein